MNKHTYTSWDIIGESALLIANIGVEDPTTTTTVLLAYQNIFQRLHFGFLE